MCVAAKVAKDIRSKGAPIIITVRHKTSSQIRIIDLLSKCPLLYFTDTRLSAALMPTPADSGLPTYQKCMKNS
jgi:hypothetical protein